MLIAFFLAHNPTIVFWLKNFFNLLTPTQERVRVTTPAEKAINRVTRAAALLIIYILVKPITLLFYIPYQFTVNPAYNASHRVGSKYGMSEEQLERARWRYGFFNNLALRTELTWQLFADELRSFFKYKAAQTYLTVKSAPQSPTWLALKAYLYDVFNTLKNRITIRIFQFHIIRVHVVKKYLYTINHKKIALNYLYFTVISGLAGALLATFIRLELSQPGSHFFKGDSVRYIQVITSHGLVMIFYVVIPLVFGTMANFFIPYHVGSKDVAYPRLNSIGFWILPAGFLLFGKPAFVRRQTYKSWDPYDGYFATKYDRPAAVEQMIATMDQIDELKVEYARLQSVREDTLAATQLLQTSANNILGDYKKTKEVVINQLFLEARQHVTRALNQLIIMQDAFRPVVAWDVSKKIAILHQKKWERAFESAPYKDDYYDAEYRIPQVMELANKRMENVKTVIRTQIASIIKTNSILLTKQALDIFVRRVAANLEKTKELIDSKNQQYNFNKFNSEKQVREYVRNNIAMYLKLTRKVRMPIWCHLCKPEQKRFMQLGVKLSKMNLELDAYFLKQFMLSTTELNIVSSLTKPSTLSGKQQQAVEAMFSLLLLKKRNQRKDQFMHLGLFNHKANLTYHTRELHDFLTLNNTHKQNINTLILKTLKYSTFNRIQLHAAVLSGAAYQHYSELFNRLILKPSRGLALIYSKGVATRWDLAHRINQYSHQNTISTIRAAGEPLLPIVQKKILGAHQSATTKIWAKHSLQHSLIEPTLQAIITSRTDANAIAQTSVAYTALKTLQGNSTKIAAEKNLRAAVMLLTKQVEQPHLYKQFIQSFFRCSPLNKAFFIEFFDELVKRSPLTILGAERISNMVTKVAYQATLEKNIMSTQQQLIKFRKAPELDLALNHTMVKALFTPHELNLLKKINDISMLKTQTLQKLNAIIIQKPDTLDTNALTILTELKHRLLLSPWTMLTSQVDRANITSVMGITATTSKIARSLTLALLQNSRKSFIFQYPHQTNIISNNLQYHLTRVYLKKLQSLCLTTALKLNKRAEFENFNSQKLDLLTNQLQLYLNDGTLPLSNFVTRMHSLLTTHKVLPQPFRTVYRPKRKNLTRLTIEEAKQDYGQLRKQYTTTKAAVEAAFNPQYPDYLVNQYMQSRPNVVGRSDFMRRLVQYIGLRARLIASDRDITSLTQAWGVSVLVNHQKRILVNAWYKRNKYLKLEQAVKVEHPQPRAPIPATNFFKYWSGKRADNAWNTYNYLFSKLHIWAKKQETPYAYTELNKFFAQYLQPNATEQEIKEKAIRRCNLNSAALTVLNEFHVPWIWARVFDPYFKNYLTNEWYYKAKASLKYTKDIWPRLNKNYVRWQYLLAAQKKSKHLFDVLSVGLLNTANAEHQTALHQMCSAIRFRTILHRETGETLRRAIWKYRYSFHHRALAVLFEDKLPLIHLGRRVTTKTILMTRPVCPARQELFNSVWRISTTSAAFLRSARKPIGDIAALITFVELKQRREREAFSTTNTTNWFQANVLAQAHPGRNSYKQGGAFSMLKNWTDILLTWELTSRWSNNVWTTVKNSSRHKPIIIKNQKCNSPTYVMSGWTFITPFSSQTRFTGVGSQDIATVVVIFAGVSSTISFTNLLITRRALSGFGLRNRKNTLPFITITLLLVMRMLAAITPVLGGAMMMLMFDRHLHTSFFDYAYGGDVILFHHLFWFFGHPEVYVVIIPVFGIVNMILPYYNTRRIASKNHLVWATYVMAYMGFLVWGHHMYLVGLDHRSRSLYSTITVMISLPAVVKIVNWTLTLLNGSLQVDVPFVFIMSFLGFFLSGGLTGLWLSHVGLNLFVHDTFYVVAHFHFMFSCATFSGIFAAIYFYFNNFFNTTYARGLAIVHYVCWTAGQWLTFIPLYWVGYNGLPRRYHDYPRMFTGWHSLATIGHLITMIGISAFLYALGEARILKYTEKFQKLTYPRLFKGATYLLAKQNWLANRQQRFFNYNN